MERREERVRRGEGREKGKERREERVEKGRGKGGERERIGWRGERKG